MKRELIYAAVIGGVVGAVLVMAAGSFSPLGAQNEVADAEFGTITCSKLVVRYDDSSYTTEISPTSVKVSDEDGRSATLRSALGLSVVGKEGKGGACVMVFNGEGVVSVSNKDGVVSARMGIDEDGGLVSVHGKDAGGAAIRGAVLMGINEGGGAVYVYDKDGGKRVQMASTENGGAVHVYGKGSAGSRAAMGVNEYGNGAVSTWDNNGYRFKTLK